MYYLGGKTRLMKHIAPFILPILENEKWFYEPFVGGYNVIPHLKPIGTELVCADNHAGLITLYEAIKEGWVPPDQMSRESYEVLKIFRDWTNPLTAFAAFGTSFGGKEFGSYAENRHGKDYCGFSKRSLLRAKPWIDRTKFFHADYSDVPMSNTGVIYCDPPYRGTYGYKTGKFDHDRFFGWCEKKRSEGHIVFVSEYEAPEHWRVLLERPRQVSINKDSNSKTAVDKLFEVIEGL